jgi:hypothetical protein
VRSSLEASSEVEILASEVGGLIMNEIDKKKESRRLEVLRQNAVDDEAYIFPKEEWVFSGDHPQTMQISPVPGTWCPPPEMLSGSAFGKILALVSCPNCRNVSAFTSSVFEITQKGEVSPDFQCGHAAAGLIGPLRRRCDLHKRVLLDEWNDKRLYACSYLDHAGKEPRIRILYTHATTYEGARLELGASVADSDIIAIGPAVGFFVDDRKGDILSAD